MSVSVAPKFIKVSRAQKAALQFLFSVDPLGKGRQFEDWLDELIDEARVARQVEIVKAQKGSR